MHPPADRHWRRCGRSQVMNELSASRFAKFSPKKVRLNPVTPMKLNRTFLRLTRKKKQRAGGKFRQPSALAGSIGVLAASVLSLASVPRADPATTYLWDV